MHSRRPEHRALFGLPANATLVEHGGGAHFTCSLRASPGVGRSPRSLERQEAAAGDDGERPPLGAEGELFVTHEHLAFTCRRLTRRYSTLLGLHGVENVVKESSGPGL